jgi:2-oxoglutarate ferredoxin oxidoreductase subunit gamma
MTERIIIAGAGGQGIMVLGRVLAEAAMREHKFVTWLPAYGAEVRGGTAHCMVIMSTQEIGSPFIDKADTLIIMNQPSLGKFKNRLSGKGLLIANSSLVKITAQNNSGLLKQPFTDIAVGLGNIKVANMVAVGCYASTKKIIHSETVLKVIIDMVPKDKLALVKINKQALLKGLELVRAKL